MVSAPALAGNIYLCKGTHGEKVYQNSACPTTAQQLDHQTYDDRLGKPPAQEPTFDGEPESQFEARPRAGFDYTPQQPYVAPRAPAPPPRPTAYACQTENRHWVQQTPCPATYTKRVSVDVDGTTDDGRSVDGTAWIPMQAPVQSQAMSHEETCKKLSKLVPASQVSERNRMWRDLGC